MTMKRNQSVSLPIVKKTSNTTAMASVLTGLLLAASTVNAASEITINQSNTGSTTVVEQYSDGQVATITATPTGISMQNGMPFSVTQVTNLPRYTINQGSTTVTSLPVNTIPVTNQMTQVGVVTTPVNTIAQVLPVTTINTPTVITQAATNQAVTVTSLETLQLTPTFSTPDIVSANTKIMKNSAGRDIAVPANHIAPGDVIEYHTTYTNTTAQPVNDLNAMVSLPNGVKLLSLNSSLPTLATTGGDSYQMISQVGNAAVIQESYSGLKWNLVNLPSNAPQTVVIRAKVQ
ncbi:hypothetical protein [Psychrobacter sp. 72-O-c]|uniref:hypothetical protein n=1 Tax=Psychrobacter sp. 72-O-c TaxID=2774125 RepID=UPI001917F1A6|nr:hypothetical protein [Psychrobacter sp. 72-O-c]